MSQAPTTSSAPAGSQTGSAHLTTAQGMAVYLFAPDKGGKSSCYGGCASVWPPVKAGTKLAASTGAVKASLLGTTTRTDGSKQLTYGGHPLYTYVADTKAGATTGQGVNASGGLWWLVSAQGAAITTGGGSGSGGSGSGGSGGSGGNYGY